MRLRIFTFLFFVNFLSLVFAALPDSSALVPMLAMNGRPTNERLADWLAKYREAGIEKFLVYGRGGCEIEYLSDDWFNTCDFLAREAQRTNMEMMLYDEFDWPSGTAKKRVMQDKPQCMLKYLAIEKDADGKVKIEKRTNPTMADLFSEEGVKYFMELTHERYRKKFSELFGKSVKCIFTDEPCVSYFPKEDNTPLKILYFDGIEGAYKAATKSDLLADIALDIDSKNPNWKEPLLRIIAERFSENYAGRIADWCAANNLKLTGHLLSENVARQSLWASGHPLKTLSKFQLPGMDEIPTARFMRQGYDNLRRGTAREIEWLTFHTVMYAAEKNGNKGALAEMFALGPCDIPMGVMRREMWQHAAYGVDTYVLGISQLDLRVRLSNDPYLTYYMSTYMNSFTPNQSWFYDLKLLAEDSKKAAHFAKKERVREIALRFKYNDKVLLRPILSDIANAQLSSQLLYDDEKSDAKIVITADENGRIFEERSKKEFENSKDFVAWAAKQSKRKVTVSLPNAALAENVFVREYKDGSYIVLNYGEERILRVKSGKEIKTVYAKECEVFFFDAAGLAIDDTLRPAIALRELPRASEKEKPEVKILGKNTLRPDFSENKKFDFELKDSLDLTFSTRNYGDIPKISLNGKPLIGDSDAAIIEGFKGLYKTVKINLPAGVYALVLENESAEFPYLPNVIISGEFSQCGKHVIKKYENDGAGLDGVFGAVQETRKVRVPDGANFVELDTADIVAELFVNGKSLGAKAWRPFVWALPKDVSGKYAEIKIERRPSFSRIFGREIFAEPKAGVFAQIHIYRPFSVDSAFEPYCGIKFFAE